MADPFDSLVSNNTAAVLLAGAQIAGQPAARRAASADRQADRELGMMQLQLERDRGERAQTSADRALGMQQLAREGELSFRREESAFGRLNLALESQLKMAEIESKERQQAFERTIMLQQADISIKKQTMELRQFQRAAEGAEMYDKLQGLVQRTALSPRNLGKVRDEMATLLSGPGFSALSPQQQQQVSGYTRSLAITIEQADLAKGKSVGAMLAVKDVDELMAKVDLAPGREMPGESLGALNALFNRSEASVGDTSEEKYAKMVAYLESGKLPGAEHLAPLMVQVKTSGGKARLMSLLDEGLVGPGPDHATLLRIAHVADTVSRMETRADELAPGWRADPDYSAEMEDYYNRAFANALSGGRPNAADALAGNVSDLRRDVHGELMKRADYRRDEGESTTPSSWELAKRTYGASQRGNVGEAVDTAGRGVLRATGGLPYTAVGVAARVAEGLMYKGDKTKADRALDDLEDARETLRMTRGRPDPKLMADALEKHAVYQTEMTKLFKDGRVPVDLQPLLQLSAIFPAPTARALDRQNTGRPSLLDRLRQDPGQSAAAEAPARRRPLDLAPGSEDNT